MGIVGFVTTAAMPVIRAAQAPNERLSAFHRFESRMLRKASLKFAAGWGSKAFSSKGSETSGAILKYVTIAPYSSISA